MLRGGRYGLIRDMAYRQAAAPDDRRFVPVAGVRSRWMMQEGERWNDV